MSTKLSGGFALTFGLIGCATNAPNTTGSTDDVRHQPTSIPNNLPFRNPTGQAATINVNGDSVALNGEFFTSFGTNGRTCGSCHLPGDGWTIIPSHVQARFDATGGLDPIFRTNDGTDTPNADMSTVDGRRDGTKMLRTKGLIRVGIGIPNNAEFDLAAVDDPYGFANAGQLSLFRRPLPSANLFFLSTVMWDGRETFVDKNMPTLADSNCFKPPFPAKCFRSINFDLSDQAIGATLGHAQAMVPGLTPAQDKAIVDFETSLMFAQQRDEDAGRLDRKGALGGPDNVASFPGYFGINDNFGDYRTGQAFTATIFTLFDAWAKQNTRDHDDDDDNDGSRAARASIARGQALFNSKPITISGVGGLNGSLGLPASFVGTCGTCHDSPEAGNHSVPAPLNIGLTDASRRTADMPLYTLVCNATGVSAHHCSPHQTIQTTDPGRALITALWSDIGRFKGPVLRGLPARAPYFHNGSAADLGAVIDFYESRFAIGFTDDERADLIAFLASL